MNHSNNSAANNGNKLTLRTQIDGLPVDRAKGAPAKSAVSVSVCTSGAGRRQRPLPARDGHR